jgi:hypothetical protein
MTPKTTPKPDDKAQSERFRVTARQVGADRGDGDAGEHLIGKLAKLPPAPKNKAQKG